MIPKTLFLAMPETVVIQGIPPCDYLNSEKDDKPRDLGIHDVWTKMGAGQKHSRYDVSHEPEMNIHESQLL